MHEIKKLTYSHGSGYAPTTLGYALDEQHLTLFPLDSNSGPCVSNHLVGIVEKIRNTEGVIDGQSLQMRFQMGLHFSATFWISDLPYGVKQIACKGVVPFQTELREANRPVHQRVSKPVEQYQQWLDDGFFELRTKFDVAASDRNSYVLTAIPYTHSDYGHGGYVFARPEFMGSNIDHKYETIIVPTSGLIWYTSRHDQEMLRHATYKFGSKSVSDHLAKNDFIHPLDAGSWAMNPAKGHMVFNTGNASVLKIFSDADIPFFPVSVSKNSDERLIERFKSEIRSLTVNQVGPRDHLRPV